jgi:hypothetical protein
MTHQLFILKLTLIYLITTKAWNYIDNTTELEYQLVLNASYFRSNRASSTSILYNWMDANLEQKSHKGVPHVDVDLNDILTYSRNSTRFHLSPNGRSIIRHRFGISGNRTRNEVIWKIVNYNGSFPPEVMMAAPQWDYRSKIEFDLTCTSNTTAISSYARLAMNETVVIVTAGDVNIYFPNFTAFYGLDPSFVFYTSNYTQYVKDCDIKIDGDKAEFSTTLNYDNYVDYLNDYLPPMNSRVPEYSIKVDKEDAEDWITAMSNARAVYDYLLFYSPYMVQDNCTEINSLLLDESNGGDNSKKGIFGLGSMGIWIVVGASVCVVLFGTLTIYLLYYRRQPQRKKLITSEQLLLGDSQTHALGESRRSSEMRALRPSILF